MKLALLDIGVRDRFREDLGNIDELAKDFQTNGQITPITVRQSSPDDKVDGFTEPFMLVAGGRRYMAAMRCGWSEIKAEALEELPPLKRLILELHENLLRKDMTWQEEVNIKAEIHKLRLQETPGLKQYETARELKQSSTTFDRDLRLAEEIGADPALAAAGSKKAALRMVEMKKHIHLVQNQSARAMQRVTTLQQSLYTMDARDYLAGLEEGSVDLMYSDPLWGIDYFSQGHKEVVDHGESLHLSEYDDSLENMKDVMIDCLPKMLRALNPTGWLVLHCGYDAYQTWRGYVEDFCIEHREYFGGGHPRTSACKSLWPEPLPWIWFRPNSQNKSRYPDLHEDNRCEYLLVVNRGNAKLFRQHQGNVLVHDSEYGDRIHSMQKPLSLCQDVVSRFTLSGMLVVDSFFGSGALLAGAASLGRRIGGCDLNGAMLQPALGYIARELQ